MIDDYLTQVIAEQASDIHLISNQIPFYRDWSGRLQKGQRIISQTMLLAWLNQQQIALPNRPATYDFSLNCGQRRLRGHLFFQQQGLAVALRVLAEHCPTLQQIALPAVISQLLIPQARGLLVIGGITGSGKSTTLAAMIDHLSQYQQHIITLEDPIEYCHQSTSSLIQQRQVGIDCLSYAAGVKQALREDPDVLVIGELRDKEAIQWALTAADTGHLVLATVHAADPQQTLQRLLNVVKPSERVVLQDQLASVLLAVVSQQLVVAAAQRQAIFATLVSNTAVSNLIRQGKLHQLSSVKQP